MTALGLILPPRSPKRTLRVPNALLLWRARFVDVVPDTGQQATFTRNATLAATDSNGTAYTAVTYQPAWAAVDTDADSVRDATVLEMGVNDALTWAIGFRPPAVASELTLYVELDPVWSRTGGVAGSPGMFAIGGTASLAADGLVVWDMYRDPSTAVIKVRIAIGTTQTEVSLAIPGTGMIGVLAQLRASGANHLLYAEIGATNATSGTFVLGGTSWRAQTAHLNNRSAGGTAGTGRYRAAVLAHGRRSAAEMAAL